MREIIEAMDVEWEIQHVREIQSTMGDTMESLLDDKNTLHPCLMFPPPMPK